jgi:hypothetical protein
MTLRQLSKQIDRVARLRPKRARWMLQFEVVAWRRYVEWRGGNVEALKMCRLIVVQEHRQVSWTKKVRGKAVGA